MKRFTLIVALSTLGIALQGCGGDSDDNTSTPTPPAPNPPAPAPAPTLTLNISPDVITPNNTADLSWSSTNASECVASGDWTGDKDTSGSEQTAANPAVGTQAFTLKCNGDGGSVEETIELTINPAPTVNLTVSATEVEVGNSVILTWQAEHADSCEASGEWSGAQQISGETPTDAITTTGVNEYSLECTGSNDSASAKVEVEAFQTITIAGEIKPSSYNSFALPDAPSTAGVTQLEGPALSSLSYDNQTLSFLAPNDTGGDYTLLFELGDQKYERYALPYSSSVVTPLVQNEVANEEDPDGDAALADNIFMKSDGLVKEIILPATFDVLSFSLVDGDDNPIELVAEDTEVHLDTPASFGNITQMFELSGSTLTLKQDAKADLIQALQTPGLYAFEVAGTSSAGEFFDFTQFFYYGSNTVSGQLIGENGEPPSAVPAGTQITVNTFGNNISFNEVVDDDGQFTLTSLPTDSFELTLDDPSSQYTGFTVVGIVSNNSNIDVTIPVDDTTTNSPNSIAPKLTSTSALVPIKRVQPASVSLSSQVTPLADDEVVLGNSRAESAAQNSTQQDKDTVTVPLGTQSVLIRAVVDSTEYPDFTTNPGNIFNDKWGFDWSCGGQSQAKKGSVNSTHANTNTRTYEFYLDLTSQTTAQDIQCQLSVWAQNIGDSLYPTAVELLVISGAQKLTVNNVYHINGLFKDHRKDHYMGLPNATGTPGTRQPFTLEVEYAPKDAEISQMDLDLIYAGATHRIVEDQAFSIKESGVLEATVTLVATGIAPASDSLANLTVTLTGTLPSTTTPLTSEPITMAFKGGTNHPDAFFPLFETREIHSTPDDRRYGGRDDQNGGDGWARPTTLGYLHSSQEPAALVFNDLTGEHSYQEQGKALPFINAKGKLVGHKEHKSGQDIDARYVDENGAYQTTLRGDGNGIHIKTVLDAAQQEVSSGNSGSNLSTLQNWIAQNRAFLDTLASDAAVKKLLVGKGYKSAGTWHSNMLIRGRFPDGSNIPSGNTNPDGTSIPFGVWDKHSKVKASPGHEGHIHISFD